jgi:hypothetical protein
VDNRALPVDNPPSSPQRSTGSSPALPSTGGSTASPHLVGTLMHSAGFGGLAMSPITTTSAPSARGGSECEPEREYKPESERKPEPWRECECWSERECESERESESERELRPRARATTCRGRGRLRAGPWREKAKAAGRGSGRAVDPGQDRHRPMAAGTSRPRLGSTGSFTVQRGSSGEGVQASSARIAFTR